MRRALVVVLNAFTHDSRVLRQVSTLAKRSRDIRVFALHEDRLPPEEERADYRLHRFRLSTRPLPKAKLVQGFKYLECLLRMTWKGIRLKPEVVHAHDLEALPIGYLIAKLARARLVYDSHELWSDQAASHSYPRWLFKLAVGVEKMLARRADAVITVTESISRHLETQMSIPAPTVIRNVPVRPAAISNESPSALHVLLGVESNVPIILYLGMIGKGRGLETFIRSMQWVQPGAVAVIMGSPWGTAYLESLRSEASHLGLSERVRFLPAVPPSEVHRHASGATIGIAAIEDYCLSYRYSLANKVFEYIQAGLPVVATDLPEMANLVRTYDLGELFQDRNAGAVAGVLNGMLSSPATLARYRQNTISAAKELNWSKEEAKLLDLYDRLCSSQA
jgi:glycosyltransferase involved in cell wall biosynthesis